MLLSLLYVVKLSFYGSTITLKYIKFNGLHFVSAVNSEDIPKIIRSRP